MNHKANRQLTTKHTTNKYIYIYIYFKGPASFSLVYFSKGTLPTKKGERKGTAGGPRQLHWQNGQASIANLQRIDTAKMAELPSPFPHGTVRRSGSGPFKKKMVQNRTPPNGFHVSWWEVSSFPIKRMTGGRHHCLVMFNKSCSPRARYCSHSIHFAGGLRGSPEGNSRHTMRTTRNE